MEQSDKDVLSRYRAGDVAALEILVERYRRPLFAYIMQMVHDQKEADDVFQEVWFRAIRKLDRYRQKSFLGWLTRIARNYVIDRSRRRKADLLLDRESETGATMINRVESEGPGPDELAADSETGRRMQAAVTGLPDEQREVFLLRVQADLPFKEIAKVQRVSINTALARMHYATRKLREELRGAYAELT